ncbi:MipA/OmpV family protein [Phenylobacterium sp.]|uniref:MipA/OmpV family protein n=1 Tax=Phenylobacterium sp. TaxID=1871053 RepID=UPI0025D5EB2D|nr:MipA/OmpV family protein [Phenylobacterium sp.]
MIKTFAAFAGAVAGAAILMSASASAAQSDAPPSDGGARGWTIFGWSVSGSVSGQVAPDYMGSKSYEVDPSGSLQFHRPGVQPSFGAPDDSPGLQVLGDKTLSAGVVVRGRSSRDDSDDSVLRGLHKIDFAFEPGLYAEWWPTDILRFHAEVRHGVVGNSAWSGDVAADLVHQDPRWVLSIGPRVHLGDSRFTRTYFDVTETDAARSPFAIGPYNADGAYVAVGGLASAEYRWTRRWSVLANLSYQRLTGDAADSPLVARLGSPDQFTGALGLRYRFGR